MRSFWNSGLAGASARPARPAGRWRRPAGSSMAVIVALAGMCLAPVSAAAASDPPPIITPPAPGVTPGTAVGAPFPGVNMFYTATDGTVWIKQGVGTGGPPVPYGGRLVSAPAPISTGSTEIVFGQGTDNQLWYNVLRVRFGQPWQRTLPDARRDSLQGAIEQARRRTVFCSAIRSHR